MAEKTGIEWTDATFNPWWGCTKISPACDHCYAERDAKRYAPDKVLWGVGSERRTFGDKHWKGPEDWNRLLPAKLGRRPRVFCASMADVFDKDAPAGERERLFRLIAQTPNLDWLLLTKRIGNAGAMIRDALDDSMLALSRWPWPNVWIGATIVTQEEADRDIPKLLAVPARVRFLSIEPMLGPIDLSLYAGLPDRPRRQVRDGLHWIIAGGESGPHARPAHPGWFRSLRDQCAAAGVPFLFKQWGEWMPVGKEPNEAQRLILQHARPTARCYSWPDGETLAWAGKKAAGRLLDGVQHDGYPT